VSLLDVVANTTSWLAKKPAVEAFELVGSALYHPEPKDVDFAVYMKGHEVGSLIAEHFEDFLLCDAEYDDQDHKWAAIRRGQVNLIVTVDEEWFERMVLASKVCHALKLQDKGDRIVVHRVVRDGYEPDAANARRDGSL
jgi:hypothetical protein